MVTGVTPLVAPASATLEMLITVSLEVFDTEELLEPASLDATLLALLSSVEEGVAERDAISAAG